MQSFHEGQLTFEFPDGCLVGRYDEWAFYRNQLQRIAETKAVDFVCIDGADCWLIEVKDYRFHPRTKPSDLSCEVAQKARDALAGLAAARVHANVSEERALALTACRSSTRWRVVLHLEQPEHPSRLRPRPIDPANLKMKLKKVAKALDPQPAIANLDCPRGPWAVRSA